MQIKTLLHQLNPLTVNKENQAIYMRQLVEKDYDKLLCLNYDMYKLHASPPPNPLPCFFEMNDNK